MEILIAVAIVAVAGIIGFKILQKQLQRHIVEQRIFGTAFPNKS